MSDTTWDCKFQKACVPRHIGTQGARCGERWLAPVALRPIGQRLAETGAAVDAEAGRIDLVPRELEILRLLAGGYSNREVARSLGFAEGTVKNYVSEILAKLDTRDRTRAVLKALTLRLI